MCLVHCFLSFTQWHLPGRALDWRMVEAHLAGPPGVLSQNWNNSGYLLFSLPSFPYSPGALVLPVTGVEQGVFFLGHWQFSIARSLLESFTVLIFRLFQMKYLEGSLRRSPLFKEQLCFSHLKAAHLSQ